MTSSVLGDVIPLCQRTVLPVHGRKILRVTSGRQHKPDGPKLTGGEEEEEAEAAGRQP